MTLRCEGTSRFGLQFEALLTADDIHTDLKLKEEVQGGSKSAW